MSNSLYRSLVKNNADYKISLNRKVLSDSRVKRVIRENKRPFANGRRSSSNRSDLKKKQPPTEYQVRRKKITGYVDNVVGRLLRNKYHQCKGNYVLGIDDEAETHYTQPERNESLKTFKRQDTYG
jgi:hypothetical protein